MSKAVVSRGKPWGWAWVLGGVVGSLGFWGLGETPGAAQTAIATPAALNGSWRLTHWGDPVAPQESPSGIRAIAHFDQGALLGFTGCNHYRTSYEVVDNRLVVSDQLATSRLTCPPPRGDLDGHYLGAIAGAQHFRLTEAGELEISYATPHSWGVLRFVPAPDHERILQVMAARPDCDPEQPCLQARSHPYEAWQPLRGAIAGFEYEPGYTYRLRITALSSLGIAPKQDEEPLVLIRVIERRPLAEDPS